MSLETGVITVETIDTHDTEQLTIEERRERIQRIDSEILRLIIERTEDSQEVGRERQASGGVRVVHGKELEVISRYSSLGPEGKDIALALLALGRGRLGH
jgi:chorismate mutase